jgi:hypothetical protein
MMARTKSLLISSRRERYVLSFVCAHTRACIRLSLSLHSFSVAFTLSGCACALSLSLSPSPALSLPFSLFHSFLCRFHASGCACALSRSLPLAPLPPSLPLCLLNANPCMHLCRSGARSSWTSRPASSESKNLAGRAKLSTGGREGRREGGRERKEKEKFIDNHQVTQRSVNTKPCRITTLLGRRRGRAWGDGHAPNLPSLPFLPLSLPPLSPSLPSLPPSLPIAGGGGGGVY